MSELPLIKGQFKVILVLSDHRDNAKSSPAFASYAGGPETRPGRRCCTCTRTPSSTPKWVTPLAIAFVLFVVSLVLALRL